MHNYNKESQASVLCVGGVDPGGFAGLLADVRALHKLGISSPILSTGLTWQNSRQWGGVESASVEYLQNTFDLLKQEFKWSACKIGMLVSSDQVSCLSQLLASVDSLPVVYDPVLGASAGGRVLNADIKSSLTSQLFPLIALLTPNIYEVEFFTGHKILSVDDMPDAALKLSCMGVNNIYIKGGHLNGSEKVDYFHSSDEQFYLQSTYHGVSARGTGCALSSLIAGYLGLRYSMPDAVKAAHLKLQAELAVQQQRGRFGAGFLFG
ncbi:MAG: hydroxymethylpyrimidine/phosphomethylpyrimidine kinase [bacterium]